MEMTNLEIVEAILSERSCMTSKSISTAAMRKFGISISPTQVGGALRSLDKKGKIGVSKNEKNQNVYWILESEG